MCLNVIKSKQIASNDIVCYKVICRDFLFNIRTPYQNVGVSNEMLSGKKDFCAVGHVGENPEEISVGAIHTFVNKKDAISEAKWFRAANNLNVYLVYSCVIPKGTSYYKGECTVYPVDSRQMCDYFNPIDFESYASERIRFVKKVFKI